MTLPRTIHRRNARKRAKARPKEKGIPFLAADFLVREAVDLFRQQLVVANDFNRPSNRYR